MIILGVDPGLATTGYGVVEEKGGNYCRIGSGCILTGKDSPSALRLEQIFNRVMDLADDYRPDALALEKLFFSKNSRTALQVGEARGTVILAAAQSGLQLYEYTPLQVKQAVTGYGKADKRQVQENVKKLCGLGSIPKPDDAADALAVAIACYQ